MINILAYYFCLVRAKWEGILLDAGCGSGIFSSLVTGITRSKRTTIELIGIDINLNYLKLAEGYEHKVACHVSYLPFRNKCIDSSISVEVIEHLTFQEGLLFLKELERVSKEFIALSTPLGFRERESSNHYMTHKSGWSPKIFKKMGYSVRYLPDFTRKYWQFIPFILPWRFPIPVISGTILAFKKINNS